MTISETDAGGRPEDATGQPIKPLPIRHTFSGGTDIDNSVTIDGLTFDEAIRVVELLGVFMRERRDTRQSALADVPAPADRREGA